MYVGCSIEEVYGVHLAGFCLWVFVYVSLYVVLYKGVYVHNQYEVVFL